ncbi:hypothetical protein BGZ51_005103 [Haplosporangium sp. Z 767]|nr:hypothetical protein BGZ50_005666 [Haplosporangium sp. Z 11]KAF9181932.1 hypothetical protein BGZ51_005103 [Haplosporangium sp. Z 767]
MSFVQALNRTLRTPVTVSVRAATRISGYVHIPNQQVSSRLQGFAQRSTSHQQRLYSTTPANVETPVVKAPRRRRLSPNSSWSPEIDKQIISLRAANSPWEYISLVAGRSVSACSERFYTYLDPSLKVWTPAMISRMNQMVEDGAPWQEIAATLNQKVVTCQHIWKTQGDGKLRVKGVISTSPPLSWTPQEIESFWRAWMVHGGKSWYSISHAIKTKSVAKCKDMFKVLVMNAIKDAPGWAKLEIFNYMTETIKAARGRLREENKLRTSNKQSSLDGTISWTPEEHEALLKAVEKHGLFSGWTTIRKLVKPQLRDEEVEAEYYKLNGVTMISHSTARDTGGRGHVIVGEWTEEEIEKFNTMMMKYSSLPIWAEEAAKHSVEPSSDDYDILFGRSKKKVSQSLDNPTEPSSSKESKTIWDKTRLTRLKRLVGQQQRIEQTSGQPMDWEWIAEHIGPGFDANMCITKWQSLPAQTTVKMGPARAWDDVEFELLVEGIRTHGTRWSMIQKDFLPDRTIDSIRRKTTNVQDRRDKLLQEEQEFTKLLESGKVIKNFTAENLETFRQDPIFAMMRRIEDAHAHFKESRSKGTLSKDVGGMSELSKDASGKNEI